MLNVLSNIILLYTLLHDIIILTDIVRRFRAVTSCVFVHLLFALS